MRDFRPLDIASLHGFYATGGSPMEIVEQVFARHAEVNDPGIFLHLASRSALLQEAAALGEFDPVAKPLWGIPFAVKDNIDVGGMPTTAACPAYSYLPESDATVVRLLRNAGALIVGKTNLDQFATGLVGVRTPYAMPRNAIDPKLVPGGSSSGSAVATAQGIVSFALGTDTAGSGRIPAGLNNIVGLKPSLGAISTTGVIPACRTLDCVSIFALTVDDAWKVFRVAAREDAADPYSKPIRAAGLTKLPKLVVGVPRLKDRQFFGDTVMEASYSKALDTLRSLGHDLVEIPFEDFDRVAKLLYEGAWVAERYAAIRDFFDGNEASLHPVTRKIYGDAKRLSAADAFGGFYALQRLKNQIAPIVASVDVICVPTAPRHYTTAELDAEPMRENSRLGTYTNFVNLLDMCGIAVPTGTRTDGLPASVTLLAPSGRDHVTTSLARDLHIASEATLGATGWPLPPWSPDEIAKVEGIELVVVGAHLSGMPLNSELQALGARFLKEVRTSADYELFALTGQTPAKPGLIRVEPGEGSKICVEIWNLVPAAFGAFVAQIPSPLTIGTIALEDGLAAKGFLVEPAALKGAENISNYGGWRAYVQSQAVGILQDPSVPKSTASTIV
ncbi:allophanate hydrolase [Rhizobium sullae]|uniref:Allophanate hydrolase n=1 Tax=Rhizobium sullae TaxID=50338 RepID=A0A4R3Q633_RHISU|nr:allophanate hydrolase [Rhizobium sullae]TCU13346.1 allophanate hydrolase [Rhizobium sullae]